MPGGGCNCIETRAQIIIRNQFEPLASLKGQGYPYSPGPRKVALPACSCQVSKGVIGLPDRNVSLEPFVFYVFEREMISPISHLLFACSQLVPSYTPPSFGKAALFASCESTPTPHPRQVSPLQHTAPWTAIMEYGSCPPPGALRAQGHVFLAATTPLA